MLDSNSELVKQIDQQMIDALKQACQADPVIFEKLEAVFAGQPLEKPEALNFLPSIVFAPKFKTWPLAQLDQAWLANHRTVSSNPDVHQLCLLLARPEVEEALNMAVYDNLKSETGLVYDLAFETYHKDLIAMFPDSDLGGFNAHLAARMIYGQALNEMLRKGIFNDLTEYAKAVGPQGAQSTYEKKKRLIVSSVFPDPDKITGFYLMKLFDSIFSQADQMRGFPFSRIVNLAANQIKDDLDIFTIEFLSYLNRKVDFVMYRDKKYSAPVQPQDLKPEYICLPEVLSESLRNEKRIGTKRAQIREQAEQAGKPYRFDLANQAVLPPLK
jgi:hypothetical protein